MRDLPENPIEMRCQFGVHLALVRAVLQALRANCRWDTFECPVPSVTPCVDGDLEQLLLQMVILLLS